MQLILIIGYSFLCDVFELEIFGFFALDIVIDCLFRHLYVVRMCSQVFKFTLILKPKHFA